MATPVQSSSASCYTALKDEPRTHPAQIKGAAPQVSQSHHYFACSQRNYCFSMSQISTAFVHLPHCHSSVACCNRSVAGSSLGFSFESLMSVSFWLGASRLRRFCWLAGSSGLMGLGQLQIAGDGFLKEVVGALLVLFLSELSE